MMDRLQVRVGFRGSCARLPVNLRHDRDQAGLELEHLWAAMGHSDYKVLQRYVRLATERDLGQLREWTELIVSNPAWDWT
jgi:hypothetical protein